MSAPKNKPNEKPNVVYYRSVRFMSDFAMLIGQSMAADMGTLNCSIKSKPSRYGARWEEGSPFLAFCWKTSDGKLEEIDVPWARVMGARRVFSDDGPAPLQ